MQAPLGGWGHVRVSGPGTKLHCNMLPLKAHIWDWP